MHGAHIKAVHHRFGGTGHAKPRPVVAKVATKKWATLRG